MISLWIRQAMTKALVLAVTVLTLLSIQTAASTPGPSPSVSFDVNLVYTTRLHPNCTTTLGPQPTVVVSTRYTPENDDDFVEWTPMLVYTDAGPHQGCTNIKLPKSSKRYQFRVQLSCADRRHCFTIGNVTCPYGLSASIRDEWRGLWNGTNGDGLLCARSSIFQRNYYSRTFHFRDNGNSVILTDDIYASNNNTQNNCTDLFPMSSCLNNPPLANVTRVCRCNGTWSPNLCQASISQAEELICLKVLLELPPNSISNTQRLEVLRSAFNKQSEIGVTKSFVQTSIQVIDEIPTDENVLGSADNSEFLLVLDEIALSLRRNETITSTDGSIVLRVREVFPGNGRVLGIQVDNSYISLPGELFENLNESVFVASFYFENIAHLFPNEVNSSISPLVISSALSCTDCRTSNLTENVTILFDLPPRMTNNKTECVFVDLKRESGTKFWKSNGCTTVDFKNGSVMCLCNHLTHFAILLSPGVEIPPVHQKVLTVIGQVFLSISLVFLLATILTFVLQKSLWDMRNYIHCMLCANLIAAQLVFVVGVERTENEAVCSAIAVLLHYLFLVVFMWMLMEGVVLYVALVKVFIKYHKRYIAAFTVASYGIPLVYMALVVPLGFLVNTDNIGNHYGQYNTTSGEVLVCWLRYDTNFIWAFISPVILIILINVGFLVMALVIMYKHLKKQEKKSEVDAAKHWLKVVITLVAVMGIAWIGNILFFDVNLIFVAYIMTVIIACQGIIIFILFVPLSKQVRDAYTKWWKIRRQQLPLFRNFPAKKSFLPVSTISSNKNSMVFPNNIALGTFDSDNSQNTLKSKQSNSLEDADTL